MSSEIDKIKKQVFNLLQKTTDNGCTEAEAVSAMEFAGKLMNKYDLTISDIQIKNTTCIKVVVQDGKKSKGPMSGVMVGLAKYCDCKVWSNSGKGSYTAFGLPQDTELFTYFFDIIKNSMESELQKYFHEKNMNEKQEYGVKRKIRTSFCAGFASRMYHRLIQMKKERMADFDQMSKEFEDLEGVRQERTGRQLVFVKSQVVDAAFKDLGLHLRTSYSHTRISNYSANSAGHSAANRVSLNHGIGSGSVKRLT